ncbi:MAG: tetratricopeptide repeat protein, partial [Pedobacter sp.]
RLLEKLELTAGMFDKVKNIKSKTFSNFYGYDFNKGGAYDLFINVIAASKKLKQDLKEASLGDIYKEIKDFDKAKQHYAKAIELGNNSVFTNLADVLKTQGNFKEAENLLLDAYAKKKIDAIPLLDLYLISNDPKKGKVSENVEALLKELGENPLRGLYKALFFLNTGKLTKEKDDKVVLELEKFVSICTKNQQWDYKFLFGCSLLLTSYIFGENKKNKAFELVNVLRAKKIDKELMVSPSVIFVDVWNENYSNVIEGISRSIRYFEIDKGDVLNDILMLLIAKKQNHIALQIFNENPSIVDLAKPTYYALMSLLKDQFPNEIIKMGEELKEPVKEILERIAEMAVEYK